MQDEEELKDQLSEIYENAQIETYGTNIINIGFLGPLEIIRIINETGKNLHNFKKVVRFSEVRHIVKRHGRQTENLDKQVQIESEHFIRIPEIITNYDSVKFQPKSIANKKGKDSLLFEKGKYSVVFAIIWGEKQLVLKTMWLKK